MRPEAHHRPPRGLEYGCGVRVASPVRLDFNGPIVGIGLRLRTVCGAPVPEAAVHEDRDARTTKYQVGCSPQFRDGTRCHAIAHPQGMHGTSHLDFRFGVPRFVPLHRPADNWRRRPGGCTIARSPKWHVLMGHCRMNTCSFPHPAHRVVVSLFGRSAPWRLSTREPGYRHPPSTTLRILLLNSVPRESVFGCPSDEALELVPVDVQAGTSPR